jgi:hypothetical protein
VVHRYCSVVIGGAESADQISLPVFEEGPEISLSMHDGDDLKWRRVCSIHYSVIRIASERPETHRATCKVEPGVAALFAATSRLQKTTRRSTKGVVNSVNGLREFIQLERKRIPGDIVFQGGSIRVPALCWL